MKKIIFFFSAALFFAACNTSDSKTTVSSTTTNNDALRDSASYTTIQWLDSTNQDLGKIKQGQVAEITWHFKNTGNKPLVIQNVAPGCGCTVADKPEEPVMPGKEAVIKAKFDSKGQQEGEHTKSVMVYANTYDNTMHQLQFKVQVAQ